MQTTPPWGTLLRMDETNFGKALARVRRKAKRPQSRIVEILGRGSPQYFGDIERGRRPIHELTPAEVDAIVSGLGFDVEGPEGALLRHACCASLARRSLWAHEMWQMIDGREPSEVVDLPEKD